MKGYRKILIAVNGSMNVLKKGIELASDERCWVTALKVIPEYEGELELTGVKNIRDVMTSDADRISSDLRQCISDEGALAKVRIEQGKVSETISRIAREENCDVVVMGRKKKKNIFSRLLSNNIIAKVLDSSPCPVLVLDV